MQPVQLLLPDHPLAQQPHANTQAGSAHARAVVQEHHHPAHQARQQHDAAAVRGHVPDTPTAREHPHVFELRQRRQSQAGGHRAAGRDTRDPAADHGQRAPFDRIR